jgi:hypothetical protein
VLLPRFTESRGDPFVFVRYDAWFALFIAYDLPVIRPESADIPAYRAQRVLMSALVAIPVALEARLRAGYPTELPPSSTAAWAMLVVDLMAAGIGSAALALLALRHHLHPIVGGLFGLWIGSVYVLHMGMMELLAYALVLCGLLCWERGMLTTSGMTLGLAALAKETALLFTVAFLCVLVLQRAGAGWRFAILSVGPPALWQLVVAQELGITGVQAALLPGNPGQGMLPIASYFSEAISPLTALQLIWVLLPAIVSVCWGLGVLGRSVSDPTGWALFLNGLFVTSLPPASTAAIWWSTRISLAVIVALAWAGVRSERPRLAYVGVAVLLVPTVLFVMTGGDFGPMGGDGIQPR